MGTPNKAQRRALESAVARGGRTHSGRGGWSANTMRAMQRLGWVRLVKEYTWETDWEVTPEGRTALAAAKVSP